jgi:hypothetical protein
LGGRDASLTVRLARLSTPAFVACRDRAVLELAPEGFLSKDDLLNFIRRQRGTKQHLHPQEIIGEPEADVGEPVVSALI